MKNGYYYHKCEKLKFLLEILMKTKIWFDTLDLYTTFILLKSQLHSYNLLQWLLLYSYYTTLLVMGEP